MTSAALAAGPPRKILQTLLSIGLLAGLITAPAAVAVEPNPAVVSPPIIVGATSSQRSEREASLSTTPVGKLVFRTLAEVEPHDALEPGKNVDVLVATLGSEGPTTSPVLKNIPLYSVGKAEEIPETEDEPGAARAFPRRVIGLLVNASQLESMRLAEAQGVIRVHMAKDKGGEGFLGRILSNFVSNLFQPLLLFFFLGFSIPLLKIPFEFPRALYQSLTLYLLVSIGWHGGELMSQQSSGELWIAAGLAFVGFVANGIIGFSATKALQWFTPMRQVDAVTVGAYYGSDSAGTFVTCLGILAALNILHDSYMPVMLAVMEIPGCLVGLLIVSHMRSQGMDTHGNMPGEPGYAAELANGESGEGFSWKILHEVFLNPGLFLLFGGIVVGFISGLQAVEDPHVVEGPNHLFVFIFKGALCLFLLEMGMTACQRLRDLESAGWGFILFGLLAPVAFAVFGMLVLHLYSLLLGHAFLLGTYALFAVLCGAASYIAVPAVQRLAIPEASPTLPLAASLGLTFTWNVTLGIPIYIEAAKWITTYLPITAA